MPEPESLRPLLVKSIDYAGLFPPCSLDLGRALENQSRYVRSADTWMLSAFVLPLGQFDAAVHYLNLFDKENPLRISALGPATSNPDEFCQELRKAADRTKSFANIPGPLVPVIEQLEMALPREGMNAEVVSRIHEILAGTNFPTFWEAPGAKASETIALLSEGKGSVPCGFKLRTGGVKADAFPRAAEIAAALAEATRLRVPIKFTAGLHHPIRQFRDEVKTTMYGFLNVLGAGVMAAEYGLNPEQLVPMLECEDIAEFRFSDETFSWGNWTVSTSRIQEHRSLITSFGSCSFDEPRDDLREYKLL